MTIHVCGRPEQQTRWRLAANIWPEDVGKERVYVPCCNRLAPLEDTLAKFVVAFGGYVSDWHFKCAARRGCNKNPNYKRTAHLRRYEWGD